MPKTGRPKGAVGKNTIRTKIVTIIAANRGISRKRLCKEIYGVCDTHSLKSLATHMNYLKNADTFKEHGYELTSEVITMYRFRPIKENTNA